MPGTVTCRAPGHSHETWRYRKVSVPTFDPIVFDAEALEQRGLITGIASAGRGGTVFFELDGHPLVLREFRRGGMVRHISTRYYVQSGLERSRAMREYALLIELESLQLPAPVVFAARRTRQGLLESGELVTQRLPGHTLVEKLLEVEGAYDASAHEQDASINAIAVAVGQCIARFHAAGVEHADLNAHNILIDESSNTVSLLDFDGGRRHSGKSVSASTLWAARNMARLARSFEREGLHSVFPILERAWRVALQQSTPSASR